MMLAGYPKGAARTHRAVASRSTRHAALNGGDHTPAKIDRKTLSPSPPASFAGSSLIRSELIWESRTIRSDLEPLLTSNCAPDRLRRLSVDTDERPSHVFRVTEADRLRDAFDRFGSRLYAASGQIGAEPFHHTRGRGAGLRPECAAELAQAHAEPPPPIARR